LTVSSLADSGPSTRSAAYRHGQTWTHGPTAARVIVRPRPGPSGVPPMLRHLFRALALAALALCPTSAAAQVAYAWGKNNDGQLGNTSTASSNVPVPVVSNGVLSGLTVTQMSAGAVHSLALANGHVYAWGRGADGELGNGSTAENNVPVAVDTSGVLS